MKVNIFTYLFYKYLGGGISHFIGKMVYWKQPRLLIQLFMHVYFIKLNKVDLSEAKFCHLKDYPRIIDLFTRALKTTALPKVSAQLNKKRILSPCAGTILQSGRIRTTGAYTIKDQTYTLANLLSGDNLLRWEDFIGGEYMIIYLSPRDCHRIYMPVAANLTAAEYFPGKLYPVRTSFLGQNVDVFKENRKLRLTMHVAHGKLVMLWVGAFNVGKFQTTFDAHFPANAKNLHARRTSHVLKTPYKKTYANKKIAPGEELGAFELGSSILLLLSAQVGRFHSIAPLSATSDAKTLLKAATSPPPSISARLPAPSIRIGQVIGEIAKKTP